MGLLFTPKKNSSNCNLPKWSKGWRVGLEFSQKLGMLLTSKKKLLQLQPTKVFQGVAGRAGGFTKTGHVAHAKEKTHTTATYQSGPRCGG
jgi:hypothetical protein